MLDLAGVHPAEHVGQATERGRGNVRASGQPVPEDGFVVGARADAVGGEQAGEALDVDGVLQWGRVVDVARRLEGEGEGQCLGRRAWGTAVRHRTKVLPTG